MDGDGWRWWPWRGWRAGAPRGPIRTRPRSRRGESSIRRRRRGWRWSRSPTAPGTNAAPDTGLERATDATTDARLLVITADGTSVSFAAIKATLDYLGTPYDVLNATTGPALTAATLSNGTHGNYYGVFLDSGNLATSAGSALSDAEWMTLTSYEATFGVRRVSLYTSPSASYGLALVGGASGTDASKAPISAGCTTVGTGVFVGANCASPVTINLGTRLPGAADRRGDPPAARGRRGQRLRGHAHLRRRARGAGPHLSPGDLRRPLSRARVRSRELGDPRPVRGRAPRLRLAPDRRPLPAERHLHGRDLSHDGCRHAGVGRLADRAAGARADGRSPDRLVPRTAPAPRRGRTIR